MIDWMGYDGGEHRGVSRGGAGGREREYLLRLLMDRYESIYLGRHDAHDLLYVGHLKLQTLHTDHRLIWKVERDLRMFIICPIRHAIAKRR